MSWLQILVLGAAVGFGEIFPLSGSGISVPVRQLLGLPLDGSEDRLYSALLRIAVWLAVCLVLRRELWSCLRAFSSPPRHRGERVQEEIVGDGGDSYEREAAIDPEDDTQ